MNAVKLSSRRGWSNTTKKTLTVQEAASVIGVSGMTVYRLIQQGDLRCVKGLRHKLIPVAEVERFLGE